MPEQQKKPEFVTTDLALAAYIAFRGLPILRTERIPEDRRHRFVFDDTLDLGEQLSIEFANSDFQKYDSHLRSLKKLIHR